MDFLTTNLLNTTSSISVDSNTLSVSNLFNRDLNYQYYSDGFNNDLTTTSIVIDFGVTTSVSRIALKDINLKGFDIFYNGVTANTFTLLEAHTTASTFSTNSETSLYMRFDTLSVSTITIDCKTTQTADQEKVIGLFYIGDTYFEFARTPSAQNYKPVLQAKQSVHRLGDGGTRIQNVSKKWSHDINFKYLAPNLKNQLRDFYLDDLVFGFCPFGTASGWDGILYEANWEGNFDFEKYSDNASTSGFTGKIKLRETPY